MVTLVPSGVKARQGKTGSELSETSTRLTRSKQREITLHAVKLAPV